MHLPEHGGRRARILASEGSRGQESRELASNRANVGQLPTCIVQAIGDNLLGGQGGGDAPLEVGEHGGRDLGAMPSGRRSDAAVLRNVCREQQTKIGDYLLP